MKTFAEFIALDEFALPTPPSKITKSNIHKAVGLPKPKEQKKKVAPKKKGKAPAGKKLKLPFSAPKLPSLGSIAKKTAKNVLFGQGKTNGSPSVKTPAKKVRSLKPVKW